MFGNEVSLSPVPSALAYSTNQVDLDGRDLSLGMLMEVDSLAYCELNLILSALFRPGGADFDMYETDESDVMPVHDMIVPLPKLDTKGVRIMFH